jgi:hypothetical protein
MAFIFGSVIIGVVKVILCWGLLVYC